MRCFQEKMILATAVLFGFGLGAVLAGEDGGKAQDQQQQVTSFYQNDDGGYIMVINNDLNEASIHVNTQNKVIVVQPGDIKGAFSIPSGGAFPMYVPAGAYQVGWGGSTTASASVNAGKTTTVAFEPYGPDNSGMRALINDGQNNTATVLYESDQQRLDTLEAHAQPADASEGGQAQAASSGEAMASDAGITDGTETAPAELMAADNAVQAAPVIEATTVSASPVVVVQDSEPVVIYESSPVYTVEPAYVPAMPAVTFAAGFVTGAVTASVFWNNFHYWNNDWYGHWHDWDDWNDHVNNRIDNRDDRINKRIDDRDDRIHDRIDNRGDRDSGRIDNRGDRINNQGQRLDNRNDRINNRGGRATPPRPLDLSQHPGIANRQMPPAPQVNSRLGGGGSGVQRPIAGGAGQRPGAGGGGVQRPAMGGAVQRPGAGGGGVQRPAMGGAVQRPGGGIQQRPAASSAVQRPAMGGGGFSQSRPTPAYRAPERHSISTPPVHGGGGGRSFGGGGGGRSFGGGGGGGVLRRR